MIDEPRKHIMAGDHPSRKGIHQMQKIKSIALAICFGIAAIGLFTSSPSKAAILLIDGGGQLTGATGVVVAGVGTFDVSFADGSCVSLFEGCNQPSDFDFQTSAAALAAADALLAQVFLDGSGGPATQFDSLPSLTFGCSVPIDCTTFIPFEPPSIQGTLASPAAINTFDQRADESRVVGTFANIDTTINGDSNFALFTRTSPVPEPASLILFGVGLLGLAGIRRRRQAR